MRRRQGIVIGISVINVCSILLVSGLSENEDKDAKPTNLILMKGQVNETTWRIDNLSQIPRPPRRSLKYIQMYPRVQDIYNKLAYGKSLDYKTDMEFYLKRDRALVAETYLLAGRISEVLRLEKKQHVLEKEVVLVQGIKLSKSKMKDKPRRNQYRQEAFLPLTGDRARITQFVLNYLLEDAPSEGPIFKFGTRHALRITVALTGEPCHWLRAYGENYLYDHWDHDILAVADYVKVDPRTLANYIRRSYAKYKPA